MDKLNSMRHNIAPRWVRCRRRKSTATAIAALLSLVFYSFEQHHTNHSMQSLSHQSSRPSTRRKTLNFFIQAKAAETNASENDSGMSGSMNYYELLDLESHDMHRHPRTQVLHSRKKRSAYRARITNDQIKKAYRKQAQLYHPDKLAARRLKQEKQNVAGENVTVENPNDSLANMTIEEATSLFTRIAQAYQVLSDPTQRYEYDWELLIMEDQQEEERLLQQESEHKKHSNDILGRDRKDSFSLYEEMMNRESNFNTWRNNLNLDPWAVFEDFFFRESSFGDELRGNEQFYSAENSYGHQRYYQSDPSQKPPRVSEKTIYRGFDPSFGAKVYTVLRREDYIHDVRNSNGKYFYQIIGQDFISGNQVDPYTGFTLQEYYSAVTKPYLVEEGHSNKGDENVYGTNDQQHQQRKSNNQRKSIHKIEQGESIIPNQSQTTNQWISPNGRYEAVLSSTCELQLLRHDKSEDGPTTSVVWTTDTYIPHSRAHGCHLTLDTLGRLILSVDYGSGLGLSTASNTILWSSPLPPVVPHFLHDNDKDSLSFKYYSSVDNDGAIAVYRVHITVSEQRKRKTTKPTDSAEDELSIDKNSEKKVEHQVPIVNKLSLMYHRLSKASIEQKTTKAALAWDQLRYNIEKLLTTRPRLASIHNGDHLSPHSNHAEFDEEGTECVNNDYQAECVYSTSSVGCLTPGRNAIYLTKTFATYLKNSVKSIDSKFDDFLLHLTEPADGYDSSFIYDYDDEGEDILDTLVRVTDAARTKGMKLGKAGMNAAQVGLKQGRHAAGKVIGKMKERVGKQSIKWGERMTDEEDMDSFF